MAVHPWRTDPGATVAGHVDIGCRTARTSCNDEIQLDLFGDYQSNVALYPQFQEYIRTRRPPLLAVWGKNDPFFLPAGAKAFARDNPDAEIHLLDAGHFALESHGPDITAIILDFLSRKLPAPARAG